MDETDYLYLEPTQAVVSLGETGMHADLWKNNKGI